MSVWHIPVRRSTVGPAVGWARIYPGLGGMGREREGSEEMAREGMARSISQAFVWLHVVRVGFFYIVQTDERRKRIRVYMDMEHDWICGIDILKYI